jgi:hypothetical protein
MRLSPSDLQTLRHAADIADAQKELVELMEKRSAKAQRGPTQPVNPVFIAGIGPGFAGLKRANWPPL